MAVSQPALSGAGLGLRRVHFDALADRIPEPIAFMEVAPENWMGIGGSGGRKFRALAERVPLVCHGLALNLGGYAPLDHDFLRGVRQFLDAVGARCYSEHLSYCGDHGHLYDLMPLPFTAEAVMHVAARIRQAQDILGQRMAIENVSYYAAPSIELTEQAFILAILEEADCLLHLDVNNVYVNSINHDYDARAYLRAMPAARIAYAHVAGHHYEAADLRIDTHGADVIDPVWELLDFAYAEHGVFPTLLERDFDVPALDVMLQEVETIARLQMRHPALSARAAGATVASSPLKVREPGALRRFQTAFTRHIRDPEQVTAPAEIAPTRMALYSRLVFGNVERVMANMFPVLKSRLPESDWLALIRRFFRDHTLHDPLFQSMPAEFVRYLEARGPISGELPFLLELAHYEWVDYALSVDETTIDMHGIDALSVPNEGRLVLNPLVWMLRYDYPVHTFRVAEPPTEMPLTPSYLVAYRDCDDRVGHVELNAVSARLLELIDERPDLAVDALMVEVAHNLGMPCNAAFIDHGLALIGELHARQVILGTRVND